MKIRLIKNIVTPIIILTITLSNSIVTLAEDIKWDYTNGWYGYKEDKKLEGWHKDKNWWYYFGKGGKLIQDNYTPDGYYVDNNGRWFIRSNDKDCEYKLLQNDEIMQQMTGAIYNSDYGGVINTNIKCDSYEDVCQLVSKWRTCYNVSINPQVQYGNEEILISINDEQINEFKRQTKEINELITKIAKPVKNKSDIEKVNYTINYIANLLEYDLGYSGATIYENIQSHKSVCAGYAKLFYLIMNKLNIQTELIVGNTNNGFHAWNRAKLDGTWYYYDITYYDTNGSPIYINNTNPNIDGSHVESTIYT